MLGSLHCDQICFVQIPSFKFRPERGVLSLNRGQISVSLQLFHLLLVTLSELVTPQLLDCSTTQPLTPLQQDYAVLPLAILVILFPMASRHSSCCSL